MQASPPAAVQPIRFIARQDLPATAPPRANACSTCHLKDLCLPQGLDASDVAQLDALAIPRRRIHEGEFLYRQGERFHYAYAVRSGTLKSTLTLADGREQVTGFHLAGDLLGLDGLAAGQQAGSALALEDTEICSIPFAQLSAVAAANRAVQQALARAMSRQIVREHARMAMLGGMAAEERVAGFLLGLSQRMKARGYSPREFHLRMSRADIGSYLGLQLETVSRTLSTFQQQGRLEVNRKHVRILDLESLAGVLEAGLQ